MRDAFRVRRSGRCEPGCADHRKHGGKAKSEVLLVREDPGENATGEPRTGCFTSPFSDGSAIARVPTRVLIPDMRFLSSFPRIRRIALALLGGAALFSACERSPEPTAMDATEPVNEPAPATPPKLTPDQLAEASARPGFFFLDVRSPKEIAELGTLPGYVNIPIEELEGRLGEIPPDRQVVTA